MKIVCDIETDRLTNPTTIWCIVCKDTQTEEVRVFDRPLDNRDEFIEYASRVKHWIGHNFLCFDAININRLFGNVLVDLESVTDTLVVSRLVDYNREGGHSLEAWGEFLGTKKHLDIDFSYYNKDIIKRCKQDVEINFGVYTKLKKYIDSPKWKKSIDVEHRMATICNNMSTHGFYFNLSKAKELLKDINSSLYSIDKEFLKVFKPKVILEKTIEPKVTKEGKPYKRYSKWLEDENTKVLKDGTIEVYKTVEFNPSSHKQIIEVLHEAGWKPLVKTPSHIEVEKEYNKRKKKVDADLEARYAKAKKYGWKVNEKNLDTLPENAPRPARTLAKRILLESRRRTLEEWIGLVQDDGRIHGTFDHIGSWTHRMAHRNPNTANIPRDDKLFGADMRSMWCVPKDRYLVGVDAEGIQLRVFAHYINDKEFTEALINGKKEDGTDPHSLNQRILGDVCQSRDAAKTFIYALLLGASVAKLSEILHGSMEQTEEALQRILKRYKGWKKLKEEIIPEDARRGWFIGLDGRAVKIWGDSVKDRRHLALSGYLQNGETVVMKHANVLWDTELRREKVPFWQVDLVHDEYQTETIDDYDTALHIANTQADSLRKVGEDLKLKCPMAGSIMNSHKKIAIGSNWMETH